MGNVQNIKAVQHCTGLIICTFHSCSHLKYCEIISYFINHSVRLVDHILGTKMFHALIFLKGRIGINNYMYRKYYGLNDGNM